MNKLFIQKVFDRYPAIKRSFAKPIGETRVVGTVPTTISDAIHQKEMKHTYNPFRL